MWRRLISWLDSPSAASVVHGTSDDLAVHLQRLLDAEPSSSFLIVEVAGEDEQFLQFTASPQVIQIDYPLITAAQVDREAALRRVLDGAGLTPYETRVSDGARFLDCDVPADAAAAALIAKSILEALFKIDATTELRFTGDGLPPLPA